MVGGRDRSRLRAHPTAFRAQADLSAGPALPSLPIDVTASGTRFIIDAGEPNVRLKLSTRMPIATRGHASGGYSLLNGSITRRPS